MKVYYSPDYACAEHAFETTRKAGWIARSLAERPIPGVELVAPAPVDEALLREVHDPDYVEAVKTGEPRERAQGQGFRWDPLLWRMVRASNGGAVAAARHALATREVAGSLSSGLHHARREEGSGFCTFNGLALAVHALRKETRAPLLVLDLDAHCGGGTISLVGDLPDVWHVDVSTNGFDGYTPPPTGGRSSLDVISRAEDYLPTIERRLAALPSTFALCLYNAGMDPFEADSGPKGLNRDLLARRERLVFDWCRARKIPAAFVLAGGYLGRRHGHDEESLVDLHRLTLVAAANAD